MTGRISTEQLLASYAAALRAKVQLTEFASWGQSVTDDFRRAVAEHEKLEAAFLVQLAADRRARDEGFKKKLGW